MSENYIFSDKTKQIEHKRLSQIENLYDPNTISLLHMAGLSPSTKCLEIGPGVGSILRFLSKMTNQVVDALDISPLQSILSIPNTKVIEGDLMSVVLPDESYDLIHSRFVVLHIPGTKNVLQKIHNLLKPAGMLVIEEPDFSVLKAVAGPESLRNSFEKVGQAMISMFLSKGLDPGVGSNLPRLMEGQFKVVHTKTEYPLCNAKHRLSEIMALSAMQLRDLYIATGKVTSDDVSQAIEFAQRDDCYAYYYNTVSLIASKI